MKSSLIDNHRKEMLRNAGLMAIAVLMLVALLCATGCSNGAPASSSSEVPDTANTVAPTSELSDDTLIVGVDDTGFPPSLWKDSDGQWTGYDYELALEATKRLGWNLEIKPVAWADIVAEVDNGTVDCIWNGFTMNIGDRQQHFTFSAPMLKSLLVAVVNSDSDIEGISGLIGKTIAVASGTTSESILLNNITDLGTFTADDSRLRVTDGYAEAFKLLQDGEVDAVVCDDFSADYYVYGSREATGMNSTDDDASSSDSQSASSSSVVVSNSDSDASQFPHGSFRIVTKGAAPNNDQPLILYTSYDAVGFKLGDQALANDITNALYEMYKDGTVESILEKYESYGISINDWVLLSPASANNIDL